MMECKKALTEAGGDLKKAEELLRIKSGAKASKAASRIAAEGVIGAYLSPDAKTRRAGGAQLRDRLRRQERRLPGLRAGRWPRSSRPDPADMPRWSPSGRVETQRQALVQKIGENITIRRFKRLQAKGKLALYVHAGAKIGVLVDYEGADEAGKDVAMHIAFARPAYLNKADVPPDIVSRASARSWRRARRSPASRPRSPPRWSEGGLNKLLGEMTLLGQPFVKDDKQTIEKMLAAKKAKVHGYAFFVVGEGIEKKSTDFAAEVMAQAGKAH